MRNVFVRADNIISPLGRNTAGNIEALKKGDSGIRAHHSPLSENPFYASLLGPEAKTGDPGLSAFENIAFASAAEALKGQDIVLAGPRTGFILSSTKGNISIIEGNGPVNEEDVGLGSSAERIAGKLGLHNEPLVISHACISGLLAMITGMRLIQSGIYDDVIVTGADLITDFILTGFQSFQAISAEPCRPFDAERDGITLGEAAATVILSSRGKKDSILLRGGSVSNDANHISGPSRTGAELGLAIRNAMSQAGTDPYGIDFISAHGTATRYNDDMEAKAIHLAGLERVPVNSLKGYFGHTLGAAGLIESVISIHSLKENILFPTRGFKNPGTEKPLNVIRQLTRAKPGRCLKTASGFGGCNAAIVLEKPD
jgi:3-oxoacyl-[acyl-carrier-protein] synthase-1